MSLNFLFVRIPTWIQKMFPSFVWSFPSEKKELYLTFDDGPTKEITDWVIDTLKRYNAKATFFCIGSNIDKEPVIFDRLIAEGHSIGNHTFDHLKGWDVSKKEYIEDVVKTDKILSKYPLNNQSKLFRPPYGKIKPSQLQFLKKNKYKVVMWDVLSLDFETSTKPEKCLNYVLKNTVKGSVVVFHDSVKASENMKYVLPKVLEYYSKKGFVFKGIQ